MEPNYFFFLNSLNQTSIKHNRTAEADIFLLFWKSLDANIFRFDRKGSLS